MLKSYYKVQRFFLFSRFLGGHPIPVVNPPPRAVIAVTQTSSIAVKTIRVSGDNSIKILDILPFTEKREGREPISPPPPLFLPSLAISTIAIRDTDLLVEASDALHYIRGYPNLVQCFYVV